MMNSMSLRQKKVVAGAVLLCVTGKAAAYGCPAVMDPVWIASVVSGISSLTNGVLGMVYKINSQNTQNEQRLISALKVQTKQIAASAEKESANTMQVMQAVASSMVAQDTAIQVQKTMENFGTSTGQGYDPCGEQNKSRSVTGGYQMTMNVSGAVRGMDTGPGVYKDRAQTLASRLNEHKQLFCTQGEKDAGLCAAVGALPGASLQFSTMFKSSDLSDNTTKAKDAFVNHVFGLPDQPIAPEKSKTPEGLAAMRDKMMLDGFRSIGATSLKSVQAMYVADASASNGTNNNGGAPVQGFADALSAKVDQYTGGNDYPRWEQSLTVQSERGLLVNLAKMAATKLYATSVEYDQFERMEANLAALLAMENRRRASQ
jgi:hypothetical protein